jgi:hypothetical protein
LKVNPSRATKILVSAAAACLIVAVLAYVKRFGVTQSNDQAHWGEFGEYLGGLLGPLFSLLAFVGVLWSIQLQRQALEDSRFQQTERTFLELVANLRASSQQLVPRRQVRADQPEPSGPLIMVSEAITEAWRLVKKRLDLHREDTPEGARQQILAATTECLHSEYNDATRYLNKLFLVYGYLDRVRLSPAAKDLYVRLLNQDVTPDAQILLMFTLLQHPKDSSQIKTFNDLRAFRDMSLPVGMAHGAPAYYALFRTYFPHLPAPRA